MFVAEFVRILFICFLGWSGHSVYDGTINEAKKD